MRKIILEIIDSYEKRIKSVSEIIEGTHDLMENFRERRKVMLEELRSNLAYSEFLRKKDFDRIMSIIRLQHKEREAEVRSMLRDFIETHKRMAGELRAQFNSDNQKRPNTDQERLNRFHLSFEQIKKEQEQKETEVRKILDRFRNEQKNFTETIDNLLKKGRNISTLEVKCVVHDLYLGDHNHHQQPININRGELLC